LDAKAPIRTGLFSRGGLNRVIVKGLDHDFHGKTPKVTPFGIYLPQQGELYLYCVKRGMKCPVIRELKCPLIIGYHVR
jgi:hypothetical protein